MEIEKMIDKELEANYDGCGRITVSLPTPNSRPYDSGPQLPREFLLEQLLDKYRQAGWQTVELKSDQREGTWIEFQYQNGG